MPGDNAQEWIKQSPRTTFNQEQYDLNHDCAKKLGGDENRLRKYSRIFP
jgi:hypothetical protein